MTGHQVTMCLYVLFLFASVAGGIGLTFLAKGVRW
jgi:hypothetical protein